MGLQALRFKIQVAKHKTLVVCRVIMSGQKDSMLNKNKSKERHLPV